MERQQIDLRMLLCEVQEEWQDRVEESKLVVRTEMPESPVIVYGDRVRLTQVMGNLLSNAIKFTDGTGRITLHLSTDDKSAIVKIVDTGRGFDAASSEDIFDPFVQRGEASFSEQGSMGLVLAISKQLIELL